MFREICGYIEIGMLTEGEGITLRLSIAREVLVGGYFRGACYRPWPECANPFYATIFKRSLQSMSDVIKLARSHPSLDSLPWRTEHDGNPYLTLDCSENMVLLRGK